MRPQVITTAVAGPAREFYLDRQQLPGNTSLTVSLSSGADLTYSVEYSVTVRDMERPAVPYTDYAVWIPVDEMAAITATKSGNLAYPATAVRLNVTAWTSGTATFTAIQGNPY